MINTQHSLNYFYIKHVALETYIHVSSRKALFSIHIVNTNYAVSHYSGGV